MQLQPFVLLGALQQGLGWNAPDVDARATKRGVTFDAGDRQAQLRGANARDIATGAATEDEDVGGEDGRG